MISDNSINIGTAQFQFPLWLEEIVPVNHAISYINRGEIRDNVDDILSVAYHRLDNARKKGRQINKSYVFVTLRNLNIDRYRKQQSERKKEEVARLQSKVYAKEKTVTESDYTEMAAEFANEAMETLDLRKRVIAKLRCNPSRKFTFKEIGNIIGYSESTAREEFKNIRKVIEAHVNAKLLTL
jgi:RNA polymerase sigma factor (sigma-70 family)